MFDSHWYLITIEDQPHYLEGRSFLRLFQTILSYKKNLMYVVLDDIQGSAVPGLINTLQEKRDTIYKIEYLLIVVEQIKNLEWGDFYFFDKFPITWKNLPEDYSYPRKIQQTDLTIRGVDGHYFYIYTQEKYLKNILSKSYKLESIKNNDLDNLDFPY